MAIQTPQSATQYAATILAALQTTGVTNTTPGGKARALADIIADQMGALASAQFIASSQFLLPYATGTALDALGAIYGVQRLQSQDANSPASDGNFEFYVQSGTFGTINNGNDIIIPAGTRIFTAASNGPVYSVNMDTTLPASQSVMNFSASSLTIGSSGNAASAIFSQSNFTNYSQSAYGSLLVTNNYAIVTGMDAEADADYQYRINLKLQSAGGSSEVDIRAALLQVPGIANVAFNSLAGTYQVFVYGVSPVVAPSLLALAQTAMNGATAYPLNGIALASTLVGISLTTTLTLQAGLSTAQQAQIVSEAQTAAANYINNLAIGAEFVINECADVIMNSDSNIIDIGSPDMPIQDIYIWRARLDGTRYSEYLVNNYTPALGEQILVEQSISNPLNITIVTPGANS
jgi:Baseplate J-like protein